MHWIVRVVALLLTLTAWSADVLHIMHVGAEETVAEHDATTGDEEPDTSSGDGLSDEPAIVVELASLDASSTKGTGAHELHTGPVGDDHGRDLMRPPKADRAA